MLCMVAFAACLFALTAFAEVVEIDGIYYDIQGSDENATAAVTIDNATKCKLEVVNIPSEVEYTKDGVTTKYKVTAVNNHAFSGQPWGQNQTIKSLTIPESVTSIGDHILRLCESIETVVINAKAPQLYDAQFYCCINLKSVDLSNSSINSFGKGYTFQGCSSLTSVKIPLDLGTTVIPNEMFRGCSSLESVEIPDTVHTIGSWAFNGCSKLANVKMPSALTKIGANAFQNCKSFTSVILPNNVITTEKDIFNSCSNLKFIVLPSDVSNFTGTLLSATSVTVVVYPGADASVAKSKISALSGHTAVDFSEYDPDATYTSKTIFYGATTCKACNGILGETSFKYENLLTEMKVSAACTHCGNENVKESFAPVFVDLGYSAFELNGSFSIVHGYKVDRASISKYNEMFADNQITTLGVFAASDSKVGDVAFENGAPLEGVIKCEIGSDVDCFEIKIVGISAENKSTLLHLGAYVNVGDTTRYVSEEGDNEKLDAAVSYELVRQLTENE